MNKFKNPLIIAHRGASDLAPENTIKAFQMAIELEADYIEFDIRRSSDRELVIIHDNCTLRTTKRLKWISRMSLKEIKLLDVGEGERVPTLEELINHTKGKINYMCEIKVDGIINQVVSVLNQAGVLDSTIIISFKHDELLKIQEEYPNVRISPIVPTRFGWLTNWFRRKKTILNANRHHFYALNPYHKLINKSYVEFAHEKDLKVFPWTVNSKKKMIKLINLGVDGFLTNHIQKIKEILNS